MNTIKRNAFIAYAALTVMLIKLCVQVSVHPGNTDSNGGHYNRATGTYHYHHGRPAHQHNNGECFLEQRDLKSALFFWRISIHFTNISVIDNSC